jgi:hypothetical protein
LFFEVDVKFIVNAERERNNSKSREKKSQFKELELKIDRIITAGEVRSGWIMKFEIALAAQRPFYLRSTTFFAEK